MNGKRSADSMPLSKPNNKPKLYLKIAFIKESSKWFVSVSPKTTITVGAL